MSKRALVLQNLYRRGRVTKEGLLKALEDGVITDSEYLEIAGVGA